MGDLLTYLRVESHAKCEKENGRNTPCNCRVYGALFMSVNAIFVLWEGWLQVNGIPSSCTKFIDMEQQTYLTSSGYAPVNNLSIYYEVYGEGKPLLLLHGTYMTIPLNFAQLIPQLARTRKVIAVEMQGHGRTADSDRPYSYDALADDAAGLLKYLGIDHADVLGYSLGGTVGLALSIRHADLVNKLIVVSSVWQYDAWTQSVKDQLAFLATKAPEFLTNTPLKAEYDRVAPESEHWPSFVTKAARFVSTPFDLGVDNIKRITAPVLLIMGDNDGTDLKKVAELYSLLGGGVSGDMAGLPKSELAILPAMTHVGLMGVADKLQALINPFLDKVQ
jgi:pimeloyl-ACP methyl ester carboxylesterase